MKRSLRDFRNDEDAATALEYALIILAVALALVGAMPTFKSRLTDIFNSILGNWA